MTLADKILLVLVLAAAGSLASVIVNLVIAYREGRLSQRVDELEASQRRFNNHHHNL
jgi:hypothetical protein